MTRPAPKPQPSPRDDPRRRLWEGTWWESDYVSPWQAPITIAGYRGPLPEAPPAAATVERLLGPLLNRAPIVGAAGRGQRPIDRVQDRQRLLVAWSKEQAEGLVAAQGTTWEGLRGWHLTAAVVAPPREGNEPGTPVRARREVALLRELIYVLLAEEPVDFLTTVTNDELLYTAVALNSPAGNIHPERTGRYLAKVGRLAADVCTAVLPDVAGSLGSDLALRQVLHPVNPASSNLAPATPWPLARALRLGPSDGVMVVGDVSGALSAGRRARYATEVTERTRNVIVTGTNGKTSTVEVGRQLGVGPGPGGSVARHARGQH